MDELALTLRRCIRTRPRRHSQPRLTAIVRTVYQIGILLSHNKYEARLPDATVGASANCPLAKNARSVAVAKVGFSIRTATRDNSRIVRLLGQNPLGRIVKINPLERQPALPRSK